MSRNNHSEESGFTIVELVMAMAFVSILLIVIALTVIQISNIYNKGLTMRAVNQSGTAISTDIRQTLGQSQPFNPDTALCLQSPTNVCTKNVLDAVGGRLCTGTYSYAWNYGGSTINKYADNSNADLSFIRIRDNGAEYCAHPDSAIEVNDTTDPREFLSGEGANLAFKSFNIIKLVDDSSLGTALYNVVFEVGTNNNDAQSRDSQADPVSNVDTVNTTCLPPLNEASLQDFCAVNKFNFTVVAGNRGGE